MFTFRKYRDNNNSFNINVVGFILKDMLLIDTFIFEIFEKKANVFINGCTLENLVFKNSYFIGDTSTGFGKGE